MSSRMRIATRDSQDIHEQKSGAKRFLAQKNHEQAESFESDGIHVLPGKQSGKMTAQDVLHLQRTVGNQAVMRMLAQRQVVQREDDDDQKQSPGQQGGSPPDISLEDEQNILRGKRLVQRAWTGRRQLGHGALNKVLGKPSVWSKSGNWFNLGLYHEHIFFEDGQAPPDIGHMGKQGLASDTARVGEYAKEYTSLKDSKMRQAVDMNSSMAEPGKYGLLTNNCQDFVSSVLNTYRLLPDDDSVPQDSALANNSESDDESQSLLS